MCLMNWAASQHNISSSLGLKQTTQLLIGRAARSRCEECMLPTSTVASQRLDRQQQYKLSVIESLRRYVTAWPCVGLHCVHPHSHRIVPCLTLMFLFSSLSFIPSFIFQVQIITTPFSVHLSIMHFRRVAILLLKIQQGDCAGVLLLPSL